MPPPEQRRPFPDKAHEDLARWVEEAITDLSNNRADTDDSFLLVDILFGLLKDAIAERDALRAAVNDHDARLSALETAHTPLTGPDAAG